MTSVSDENDATASGQILTHKNGTTSKRKREAVVEMNVSAEKKRKLDGEETDAADTSTTTKSTSSSSNGDVGDVVVVEKVDTAF